MVLPSYLNLMADSYNDEIILLLGNKDFQLNSNSNSNGFTLLDDLLGFFVFLNLNVSGHRTDFNS